MFCTTECWDCEDKRCDNYISKTELYFENQKNVRTINRLYKYISKLEQFIIDVQEDEYGYSKEETIKEILQPMKGGDENDKEI